MYPFAYRFLLTFGLFHMHEHNIQFPIRRERECLDKGRAGFPSLYMNMIKMKNTYYISEMGKAIKMIYYYCGMLLWFGEIRLPSNGK